MKKIIFISFSLIWTTLCFSQIRIANPTYEFGDIFEENGPVHAKFELENPYLTDTIVISSIETTCGCTVIETYDSIIYPRTKMQLKVKYDPSGRVGRFHKSVLLNTITGKEEVNKMYLKIGGNVVPRNKVLDTKSQLIDFEIAPLYFYPVTEYDTSFLDFNFIKDFVNTLTYEIDFHQFSKVSFDVSLKDESKINEFDYLLRFVKYKLIRELKQRGYSNSSLFFTKPNYSIEPNIPSWASAEIKVFSTVFNNNKLNESKIKMTNHSEVNQSGFLIFENSDSPINVDILIEHVDFKKLTNKLMKDSVLALYIDYKVPESFSVKKQDKLIKNFKKSVFKELESLVGIEKNELKFEMDSIFTHPSSKHKFVLREKEDSNSNDLITYQPEKELIISPLLPSCKYHFSKLNEEVNENTIEFKQFWNTLMSYSKSNSNIKLILESSTSHLPKGDNSDVLYVARQRAEKYRQHLQEKYYSVLGKSIDIEIITVVLGPKWNEKDKYKKFSKANYLQYEYVNLIPLFTNDRVLNIKPISTLPYMVNYDYFFKAVDTNSFVFKRFANYLVYEIQKNGYVKMSTESSNSKIPFDKNKSNEYIAYEHLNESKKILNEYLKKHLIDPNRLIIDKENIIVQGIPYSKKKPIMRYKQYHYLRFIPENYLTN